MDPVLWIAPTVPSIVLVQGGQASKGAARPRSCHDEHRWVRATCVGPIQWPHPTRSYGNLLGNRARVRPACNLGTHTRCPEPQVILPSRPRRVAHQG